jgi:hypothetical protein
MPMPDVNTNQQVRADARVRRILLHFPVWTETAPRISPSICRSEVFVCPLSLLWNLPTLCR